MASGEREFEEQLEEAGNRLLQPPSSVDELLSLLDQVENFLSRVEQSPLKSMQTALSPSMKALVADKLLRHPDVDAKVAVASCISEITRITAPDAPYDDDQMKDVFQLIVSSFENLSDKSSRSYNKRTLILETVAKVRSCVVMLDLECDGLIVEMFHHFLKSVRDYHPENVFSSMVTIMSLVLEESEDISFELISPILASLKKDNQEVLPIARKLGVRVFENCAIKVKPYLIQAKESLGHSFDDYSKVIASICDGTTDVGHNNDDTVRHNDDDACGEQLVHWMDISSSSNGGGVMKYRSKICYCGSKATIKVTESKKNRGKLYYLCPNGKCGFWEWCKPVNSSVGGEMMMEDTQTTVNRHTLSYEEESLAMNLMNQMGAMQTRMQVLEANMGFIKMIMIMNFVMCLISLMVALKM